MAGAKSCCGSPNRNADWTPVIPVAAIIAPFRIKMIHIKMIRTKILIFKAFGATPAMGIALHPSAAVAWLPYWV